MDIALSRTQTSDPVTRRQALFALLDAVRDPVTGYSHSSIFGPEARDALLVWAALHRLDVRTFDHPTFRVWQCVVNNRQSFVDVQVNKP